MFPFEILKWRARKDLWREGEIHGQEDLESQPCGANIGDWKSGMGCVNAHFKDFKDLLGDDGV